MMVSCDNDVLYVFHSSCRDWWCQYSQATVKFCAPFKCRGHAYTDTTSADSRTPHIIHEIRYLRRCGFLGSRVVGVQEGLHTLVTAFSESGRPAVVEAVTVTTMIVALGSTPSSSTRVRSTCVPSTVVKGIPSSVWVGCGLRPKECQVCMFTTHSCLILQLMRLRGRQHTVS